MDGATEDASKLQALVTLALDALEAAARNALPGVRVVPVSLNLDVVSLDPNGDTPEAISNVTRRTLTVAFLEARVTSAGSPLLTATAAYRAAED